MFKTKLRKLQERKLELEIEMLELEIYGVLDGCQEDNDSDEECICDQCLQNLAEDMDKEEDSCEGCEINNYLNEVEVRLQALEGTNIKVKVK